VEKLKRQAENSSQKQKMAEEELDKMGLEIEQLKKDTKRLEMEKESRKMKGNAKEQELNERELELEKKRRELEAKTLALNQNADIQKLSQRLMMNRQEMKDKLLTDIKKSNSVLDFLNKDTIEPEVFMNQSMANLGWEDPKSYMVMNEKFKGLVELLKNKLENLQREKDRMDKKNEKYKKNSKELKEKLENTKNEVQMMETTNTLKEDRISKLKEEVKELKESNKAMAQELEESLSKRPVSARVRNYGEGEHMRGSEVMNQNTRNNFNNRADLEELRKLENEISVLKDMVNKRDYKIEQLKEVIKNNEMIYEKSIEEHNMIYSQKMQDHQNLLERLKEMADASQSFHEMIREVSEENLELKERIDAEIRKRKRIVKTLKAEILELRVQIKGLGQLFRQMDHIKSQLNIEEVEEFDDTEGEEEEHMDERGYKDDHEEEDSQDEEGELEDEEDYDEDDEDMDDLEEEDEHENEIKNSRLFRKNRSKARR
jgi:hypothetical protein